MMSNLKKVSRLKRTAYHEAGHTVMSHDLSHATRSVSIIPDESDNTLGHHSSYKSTMRPDLNLVSRTIKRIEEKIMILFAGSIAEKVHTGRYNHVGADSDRRTAVSYASYIISDRRELEAYLKWLWIRTENILKLKPNRAAVEALANELLNRQRLSGREVKDIINDTYPGGAEGARQLLKSLKEYDKKGRSES